MLENKRSNARSIYSSKFGFDFSFPRVTKQGNTARLRIVEVPETRFLKETGFLIFAYPSSIEFAATQTKPTSVG